MSKGFLVSDGSTHALSTSWQAFAVSPWPGDPRSQRTPGAPHVWAVELDFSAISTAATVQAAITYDSGATKTVTGPSDAASIAELVSTLGNAAIRMDAPVNWPTGTTVGTLYVWLKVNAGTPTIAARGIRAQYTDAAGE